MHTSLVILANFAGEMSPDTTLSRRLGLFLSFKLTNNERILALYPPVLVPSSSATAFSIATALWAIKSLAIKRQGLENGDRGMKSGRTGSRFQCECIVKELNTPVASLIPRPVGTNSVTFGGPCLDFWNYRGRDGLRNGVDLGRSDRRDSWLLRCYKGCEGPSKASNGRARTLLGRRGRVVFSGAAGGPFGLLNVVLPLFYDILRCLGHTFIRMRSQFSNGETSLAFLW